MTINQARGQLILYSILCTGIVFIFFTIAPVIGFYSLSGVEWRIPQMVIPVFVGYIASASHFMFNSGPDAILGESANKLLRMILYGGFGLFFACSIAIITAYYLSNIPSAASNTGHSIDWLANGFTIILSMLSASTSIISSYIFSAKPSERNQDAGSR